MAALLALGASSGGSPSPGEPEIWAYDVCRGVRYPALVGWYLFGDYCSGDLMLVPAAAGEFEPRIVLSSAMAITSVDLNGGGLHHAGVPN